MKKANELLNQSAHKLAEKHQQRLRQMTLEALELAEKKPFLNSLRFLLPPPAYAAAALLFISAGFGWLSLQNSSESESQIVAQLPEWLSDEQVPMELLENPDFYQWLAKQPKIPQA
ncbi:MAG: hypothetical protein Q9N68_05110 [Gammaproteobacteria bacterium]|nr:hypothetical protein [Gammaproteobacteria bacterium]